MRLRKLCFVIVCLSLVSFGDCQETSEEESNENEVDYRNSAEAQSAEDTNERKGTRKAVPNSAEAQEQPETEDEREDQLDEPIDEEDDEPVERRYRRPINKQRDEPLKKPVNKQLDDPCGEGFEEPGERQLKNPANKQPVDGPLKIPIIKPPEEQVEKPVKHLNGSVVEQLDEPIDEQLQQLELTCPDSDIRGQIIGGQASSIRRHPYQVSMVINGNSFCGGFIISRNYVLTAAHCVRGTTPNRVRVRVGSTRRDTGGRIVQVSNITVHPLYGRPRFDNDIAALRLARPLRLRRNIRPIRLPRVNQQIPLVRLTVTGWGLTAPRGRRIPRVMMEARVPVVPHWICRLSYGSTLTNNMFCGGHFLIGGVSSCQGDSGGPAVFRGTALGIVSFARGCALPLSPTVFTNVAAMRPWIQQTTGV